MSKLAHSNRATMEEIELQSRGLTKLPPPPKAPKGPQCEMATPPKWYRPDGGRCPYEARYVTNDGKKLCRLHARRHGVTA